MKNQILKREFGTRQLKVLVCFLIIRSFVVCMFLGIFFSAFAPTFLIKHTIFKIDTYYNERVIAIGWIINSLLHHKRMSYVLMLKIDYWNRKLNCYLNEKIRLEILLDLNCQKKQLKEIFIKNCIIFHLIIFILIKIHGLKGTW